MTVDNNSSDRRRLRRSEIGLGIVTPMPNEEENAALINVKDLRITSMLVVPLLSENLTQCVTFGLCSAS